MQKRARQQAEKGRTTVEQERVELANEVASSQTLRNEAERRRKLAEQQANELKSQIAEFENQKGAISAQLAKVYINNNNNFML